eukprot:CAMPEP_0180067732 /NCGR_PEP_ID=MMETSP0985-20121206/10021_1 /TAXON_ID=483367 /ORGANISM="non described non described, Strain CCMP 2436" /LENGTH=94 /DNA_ID=CAMNT_0021998419 /DNA_START=40 /DNA_END=324 /DNA_ORIENTATION=-
MERSNAGRAVRSTREITQPGPRRAQPPPACARVARQLHSARWPPQTEGGATLAQTDPGGFGTVGFGTVGRALEEQGAQKVRQWLWQLSVVPVAC